MFDFFKGTPTRNDLIFSGAVVLLAVLIGVGYYFVLWQKQEQTQISIKSQTDEVNRQLQQAYNIRDNIQELREEAAKMNTLVSHFEERLPAQREIPRLLDEFERMADNVGLGVQLDPLPTVTDASKETIPYRIKAWGGFHQIASFINLLERDKRYLKVSGIDIGEEKAGVAEATFTLSTFRFIQSRPKTEGTVQ